MYNQIWRIWVRIISLFSRLQPRSQGFLPPKGEPGNEVARASRLTGSFTFAVGSPFSTFKDEHN